MTDLPPLEALRFFEAAARHGSFAAAAKELGVSAAAVSYRVKALERHLGAELFQRYAHGVSLNVHGRGYLRDIERIFAELRRVTERRRDRQETELLKLVAIEVVAEKWLMPLLADFRTAHPDIAIEFEVDHGPVDPKRRDFDVWIAFTDEVPHSLHSEKLFEETLFPVCSPGLLAARGRPREPGDLKSWPLVYDLHWTTDWSHWFSHHGVSPADLSRASGFRLYTMVVQAAVDGLGVALGHSVMIARELNQGALVALFDSLGGGDRPVPPGHRAALARQASREGLSELAPGTRPKELTRDVRSVRSGWVVGTGGAPVRVGRRRVKRLTSARTSEEAIE